MDKEIQSLIDELADCFNKFGGAGEAASLLTSFSLRARKIKKNASQTNKPVQFVKLIAKPHTWFKSGTEVFDYDSDYSDRKRITLEYWNRCLIDRGICVRGIRVCEFEYEQEPCLECKPGEEREDGEYCSCDEFDVEIVNEPYGNI